MKNTKKIILLLLVLLISLIFSTNFSYAENSQAYDEATLNSAIENIQEEGTIELTANIVLTKPIEITGKKITINGKGNTISSVSSNWNPSGDNSTLLTAGSVGTTLNLVNLTLKDSPKYGVQAYNGGYVVLNDVTISNCSYGGVLVNAGTVEIKNLVLEKNGKDSNNGIEIAKGSSITTGDNKPTVIMNGTLSSTQKDNVIYIAINDKLAGFEVTNTETTINKIFADVNKVVITDQNNNILYVSNEVEDLEIIGDSYSEAITPVQPETPVKDETPKTGTENALELAILITAVSIISVLFIKRKEF